MKTELLFILLLSFVVFSFSISAKETYSSISECKNIQNEYIQVRCYTQFAKQNNDVSLCFLGKTYKGYEEGVCVSQVAISGQDISICNHISPITFPHTREGYREYIKQNCIAEYYIAKEDRIGCNNLADDDLKQKCLSQIKEIQKNSNLLWLFISFLILTIVTSTILLFFKIDHVTYITVITFLLFPSIVFSRYAFKLENFSRIAGGDANFHSVILLFYGIFCFVTVFFNLKKSFNGWAKNDIYYKKSVKLTYLYAILFSLIISFISITEYGSLINLEDIVSIFSFGLIYIGGSILLPIGIISIIYSIKAYTIREGKERGFLVYTILASILFTLGGAVPAFSVINFWIYGLPPFGF